jgi:hypothetical protein
LTIWTNIGEGKAKEHKPFNHYLLGRALKLLKTIMYLFFHCLPLAQVIFFLKNMGDDALA